MSLQRPSGCVMLSFTIMPDTKLDYRVLGYIRFVQKSAAEVLTQNLREKPILQATVD